MKISIEVLKIQNLPLFWSLFSQLIQTEFPGYLKKVVRYFLEKGYSQYNFRYWLINNLKTILVAKTTDNEIVGLAVIDQPYGGVSFCRWLAVKKNHQKKGIGQQLITYWINLAKTLNCHKVEIASQPEAKEFYKKIGLILEGKRTLSYFGIDQYIFGRVINQVSDEVMTRF